MREKYIKSYFLIEKKSIVLFISKIFYKKFYFHYS